MANNFERHTKEWLQKLQPEDVARDWPYESSLYGFALSLSWRVARREINQHPQHDRRSISNAARIWKDELNRLRSGFRCNPKGCTHHCFIDYGMIGGDPVLSKSSGGSAHPRKGFLMWRIGPLVGFAMLERSHLSSPERMLISESELSPDGGVLHEVRMNELSPWMINDFAKALTYRFLKAKEGASRRDAMDNK